MNKLSFIRLFGLLCATSTVCTAQTQSFTYLETGGVAKTATGVKAISSTNIASFKNLNGLSFAKK